MKLTKYYKPLGILAGLALTAGSAHAAITVGTNATWADGGSPQTEVFDASAGDKLVIIVSGEHNFGGTYGNGVSALTYDGQTLIKAVDHNSSEAGSPGNQNTLDIWYLDNPGAYHTSGNLSISVNGNGTNYAYSAFTLLGTATGHGATGVSIDSKTVSLTTTGSGSFVAFALGTGGSFGAGAVNASGTASILPDSPVGASQINGNVSGGNYAGLSVAGVTVASPTTQNYSFDTDKANGLNTIAAEFQAIPEPSTTALLGLGGLALIIRRRK